MVRLEILFRLYVVVGDNDLHSSMVRLEMNKREQIKLEKAKFTFQYGQIRNS